MSFLFTLIPVAIGAALVLFSVDGARAIFRGTRDHLIAGGCDRDSARAAAGLAGLAALCSGVAFVVWGLGWIGGRRKLPRSYDKDTHATH